MVTKKELYDLFEKLKRVSNIGKELYLDYDAVNGGYRLVTVSEAGGYGRAYSRSEIRGRLSKAEMYMYLETCVYFESRPVNEYLKDVYRKIYLGIKTAIETKGSLSKFSKTKVLNIGHISNDFEEVYTSDGDIILRYPDGHNWYATIADDLETLSDIQEIL